MSFITISMIVLFTVSGTDVHYTILIIVAIQNLFYIICTQTFHIEMYGIIA